MMFCCLVLVLVGLFGYSRYEAAQSANAAFRAQLQTNQDQQATLGTRMPGQLPARGNPEGDGASPTPQPGQQ